MNQLLKCGLGCLVLAVTTAAAAQKPFPDTPPNHWAYVILRDLKKEGLLAGWPDGFIYRRPPTTRLDIATAVVETYKKARHIDQELNAQVNSLVKSVDLTICGAKTEQLQAEVALLRDLNDARGWDDGLTELEKLAKASRKDVATAGGDVDAICRDLEIFARRLNDRNPVSYWARIDTAFAALAKRHETYPDIPENHWVFEALKRMKRDGLLVGTPPDLGLTHRGPAKRREIAEAVVATYKRLKDITERLDAQIKELSAALDDKPSKSSLDELRAKLADLQKDVNGMKPWGDDIVNLAKLVSEFKPDIAAMGEDVEAMLKDLGDLRDRTCALEKARFGREF